MYNSNNKYILFNATHYKTIERHASLAQARKALQSYAHQDDCCVLLINPKTQQVFNAVFSKKNIHNFDDSLFTDSLVKLYLTHSNNCLTLYNKQTKKFAGLIQLCVL